jgi:hypothetical protein
MALGICYLDYGVGGGDEGDEGDGVEEGDEERE